MCSMHKVDHEYDICFLIYIPIFAFTDFHMWLLNVTE